MAATNSLAPPPTSAPVSYTSFRNVSACNRCRLRKNRCDQRLPRCHSCEKAKVHCVGYDATTKREVPRSYLFFLESRVAYLEETLKEHGIEVRPATAYEGEDRVDLSPPGGRTDHEGSTSSCSAPPKNSESATPDEAQQIKVKREREEDESNGGQPSKSQRCEPCGRPAEQDERKHRDFVANVNVASAHGASDPRFLGSATGTPFARVVFAAVKSSVPATQHDDKSTAIKPSDNLQNAATGTGSMRDSFFGLQLKPGMKQAPLPDREIGEFLAELYFEHANPQVPILHRYDFMETLDRVYRSDEQSRSARDLYTLFIVFAIGSGVSFGIKNDRSSDEQEASSTPLVKQKFLTEMAQPEEYHASATVYLDRFLGQPAPGDGVGGNLDELQAVLLLASFALLRPASPGLWYIVGAAMRLAIDLGLHYEDGTGVDAIGENDLHAVKAGVGAPISNAIPQIDAKERGRREWVRDLRRRLFWCCYVLDRLVSICVGRPFAIPDHVITTEFPSLLDDKYITKQGFLPAPENAPSYKLSALHLVKLRLLQSEIQEVLHNQQAKLARQLGKKIGNQYLHSNLPCPFLHKFDSFSAWRVDIMRRLEQWKDSAPAAEEIGVRFPVEFLELNYWQTVIMLYRQSLTVPEPLARELDSPAEMPSPSIASFDQGEDEEEMYVKVAEAGRKVLRIYRQLHRVKLVNYTYLATHSLFMAGVMFLYAIWHSPAVRSRLTLEEVDLTILAATSVMGDLIQKCPPAEACRDAFQRMSDTTVRMCLETSGFGSQVDIGSRPRENDSQCNGCSNVTSPIAQPKDIPLPMTSAAHNEKLFAAATTQPEIRYDPNTMDIVVTPTSSYQERPTIPPMPQSQQCASTTEPPFTTAQADDPARSPALFAARTTLPFVESHPLQPQPQRPQQQPQQLKQQQQPQQQPQPFVTQNLIQTPVTCSGPSFQQNAARFAAANPQFRNGTTPASYPFSPQDAVAMTNPEMYAFPTFSENPTSGATGVDLGFGLAVDYEHDWSEGVGVDLLDGYFFGGGHS